MTVNELLTAFRNRIANPHARIDLKSVDDPPQFAPATAEELVAAEADLGFALPRLLKQLYSEVGNGGFGPGAGLLGVQHGYADLEGRTLSEAYCALCAQAWPRCILPLCDLGGGARSCVDMRSSGDDIVTVDAMGITRTRFTLFSWLEAWVSGVDLEEDTFEVSYGTVVNPFTRTPHVVKQRGRAKGVLLQSFGS